ncbi:serine hydrolase domain-containing protein [Streptosporangium sp. NPDC023615]|uniref:serine hydrolase domain-containing protein n=1 Tax=Streptosporangium sp. NPDC023615 TaxID=3154794 RepID=UPI003448D58C
MRAALLGAISLVIAVTACSPSPRAAVTATPGTPHPSGTPRPSGAGSPEAPGTASEVQAVADDLVSSGSPGAVVHVRDDGRIREAAAGFADLDARTPMRVDHRFRIASVTKTFTATIVLQLVRERRLTLGDTLGKLLPGVLPGTDRVTVEQLLTHTSGIPDYLTDSRFTDVVVDGGQYTRDWPPRELLGYGGKPGKRGVNRYSNSNFILLGMIIEKVTGQSYPEALSERVTGPLRLRDTELPRDLLPGRLARGRQGDGPGSTTVNSSIFWAAGGLVSTTRDVGTLYEALFAPGPRASGRGTGPSGVRTRVLGKGRGRTTPLPDGSALKQSGGMGVYADRLSCGARVWNHSGLIYGYSGVAMSSEDGRRQVVVQLNSPSVGQAIAAAGKLMCR